MNEQKEMTARSTSVSADVLRAVTPCVNSITNRDEKINPLETISMSELYKTVYPNRPPLIDGLLYPGAYLFVGAPKLGKSFLIGATCLSHQQGNGAVPCAGRWLPSLAGAALSDVRNRWSGKPVLLCFGGSSGKRAGRTIAELYERPPRYPTHYHRHASKGTGGRRRELQLRKRLLNHYPVESLCRPIRDLPSACPPYPQAAGGR